MRRGLIGRTGGLSAVAVLMSTVAAVIVVIAVASGRSAVAQDVPVAPSPETYPAAHFELVDFSLDVGEVDVVAAWPGFVGFNAQESGLPTGAYVHDLATGITVRLAPPSLETESVVMQGMSADADVFLLAVVGVADEIYAFRRSDGRLVKILAEDGGEVHGIAVSDDGRWAVTRVEVETGDPFWTVFDIENNIQVPFFAPFPEAASPDAAWFAVRVDDGVVLRSRAGDADVPVLGTEVGGVSLSRVRADGSVRVAYLDASGMWWVEVADIAGAPSVGTPQQIWEIGVDGRAVERPMLDHTGAFASFTETEPEPAGSGHMTVHTAHLDSGVVRSLDRGQPAGGRDVRGVTEGAETLVWMGDLYIARAEPFDDAWANPHEAAIRWAWETAVTAGCEPARYCPTATLTRAQMASLLVRTFGSPASDVDAFVDDDGSVHESAINALAATGVVNGCAEGLFCPDDPLTRAQMASLLHRMIGFPAGPDAFIDDDGSVHEAAINALAASGVTAGCDTQLFCPGDHLRRDQMATLLYRATAVTGDG